jgi:hypothetical protein
VDQELDPPEYLMSRQVVETLFFPYVDNGRESGYVTVFME